MIVRHLLPHSEKCVGGISSAVSGLVSALQSKGIITVTDSGSISSNCIYHIHGLWNLRNTLTCKILRKQNIPYVVSPHGMLEPWALNNRRLKKMVYWNLLERRNLNSANSVIAASSLESSSIINNISHNRVDVLSFGSHDVQGVDYSNSRDVLGWAQGEVVVLYLSRLDRKKGLEILLESAVGLQVKGVRFRLVIVGDGDPAYVKSLKKRIKPCLERSIEIDWVGAVWGFERWKYLQGADVFCLPTSSENFGLSVLEALLVGTPVITTVNTPWAQYINRDGIFITDNNIESFSNCLRRFLINEIPRWGIAKRRTLAEWAINSFSWERIVDGYIACYERCQTESKRQGGTW